MSGARSPDQLQRPRLRDSRFVPAVIVKPEARSSPREDAECAGKGASPARLASPPAKPPAAQYVRVNPQAYLIKNLETILSFAFPPGCTGLPPSRTRPLIQ